MKLSATHAYNCIDFMVKFSWTSCEDIPLALNFIYFTNFYRLWCKKNLTKFMVSQTHKNLLSERISTVHSYIRMKIYTSSLTKVHTIHYKYSDCAYKITPININSTKETIFYIFQPIPFNSLK